MSSGSEMHQSTASERPFEFQVGGSLPLDAVSYVRRRADQDLYEGLKASKFCYVLNSRQMGKSSLRVRTMARLQGEGIVCVAIDMTAIGSAEVTAEQWYLGVMWAIVKQVREQGAGLGDWRLPVVRQWWEERSGLPLVQRWGEFVGEVLLAGVAQRIVVFVDEIDGVLGLPFRADDFFAAIRELYNRRVDEPDYGRLTFALLGVCAPSDLIQNKRRTPFNIGVAIELSGFTFEEARGLAAGLPGGEATLREVLDWTGGQPFLTQRVCRIVAERGSDRVDEVVADRIISVWESQDEQVHFRTIQDQMLADESISGVLLGLYGQVLETGGVSLDASAEQLVLRLTGVGVKRGDRLVVANRIYQEVFDGPWVTEKLTALRPYGEALKNWVKSNEKTMWLLKGDKLKKAQDWASEKDRKLTSEDYRFLLASSERENRILAKKIKDSNKKIPRIRASSISVESQNAKIESYNKLVTSQQKRIEFQGNLIASQIETIKIHKNQINLQAAKITSLERIIRNIRESISVSLQKEQYSRPAPKEFSDSNRLTSPKGTQESEILANLDRLIISIPIKIIAPKESILDEDIIPGLIVILLGIILFFYLI